MTTESTGRIPSVADPAPEAGQIRLSDVLPPVWRARKPILLVSGVAAILTLAVNFLLLTPYYRSTTTLLPETDKNKLGGLGQLAGLASLAGVNVGGSSDLARLYPAIITSETIVGQALRRKYHANQFADSVDLITYLDVDGDSENERLGKATKEMSGLISTSFDPKTNIVTVSLDLPEPQLSADVLNVMIAGLDQYMRLKRITNASEQLKWIEVRLDQVKKEMSAAEERLKDFREKNRRIADSPELILRQERLGRDVTVLSTVFVELTKQLEIAKIEEIRNIGIVNVLDPARPAIRKERPHRLINTLIVFLLAAFLGGSFVALNALRGTRIRELVARITSGNTESAGNRSSNRT